MRQHHITKAEDKVSKGSKIGYGAGMASERLQATSLNQMANPIFHDILGIDPRIVGSCLGISRVIDAITDPIIGYLSDNTRSKFGRRRPWIALSAILCAITFIGVWVFPSGMSQNFYILWLILSTILFYISLSIFSVPYGALGMELSPDYHERTSVMAYKSAMAKMGGFLTSSIFLIVTLDWFDDMAQGMRYTSIGLGLMIIIFSLCPVFFSREHPSLTQRLKEDNQPRITLTKSLRHTLANGPFLLLIGVTVVMLFGLTMVSNLGYYITVYYMFDGARETATGLILTSCGYSAQLGGLSGIPVMAFIAKRIGKRKTLLWAIVIALASDLLKWVCFNPTYPWLSLIPAFVSAFALVSVWTLMQAMLPDVVDLDDLRTNQRREGMYSAIYSWTRKVGMSLSLIISGFILNSSGLDPALGADQADGTITKIRIYYTLVPAIAMIGGFVLMYFYPITEDKAYSIRAQLDKRQNGT